MEGKPLPRFRKTKPLEYQVPRELEHPLNSIRDVETQVLVWVQPHLLRAAYELWGDDRVFATLRYKSFAHRRALAASNDGVWTIEDMGQHFGGVRLTQLNRPVGRLERREDTVDVLTLDSGKTFLWARKHAWRNENSFLDLNGREIIQFIPEKSMTARLRVQLSENARALPELSLLTLLGLYLMLYGMSHDDSTKQIGA